jgi:asparagine synthase (glutamine-hydrolysing)
MCGIAASMPSDIALVRHILGVQSARGPDQREAVDLKYCSVGVNRLAITDLAKGNQPLMSQSGDTIVVFNGAIYNSQQLCNQFGFSPRTGNDGEVIHYLYETYGLSFADYLEGMFAICIADVRRQLLVYCTDQLGVKPLYVARDETGLRLASTIQSFPISIRRLAKRVRGGVVFSSDGSSRPFQIRTAALGELDALLNMSVQQQIPTEVPWACMLSGGVDSTLIAALAAKKCNSVRTYTCGFDHSEDLRFAADAAEILGTEHQEVKIDPEELPSVVSRVVRETASFEPWTIVAGTGTFLTARAARRDGIKVLLSGEGADELFAGYDEFLTWPSYLINSELVQYQIDLAVTECLRLDRATMANSIEARVPYLSSSIIRFARTLPLEEKLLWTSDRVVRKVALRRCAMKHLPEFLALREKAEFANGSGLSLALKTIAHQMCPPDRLATLQREFPKMPLADSLWGWLFSEWLEAFDLSIGYSWEELRCRGIVRQQFSEYKGSLSDPTIYIT